MCSLGDINQWAGLQEMECLMFKSNPSPGLCFLAPPFLSSRTTPAPPLLPLVLNFHQCPFPCILPYGFKHRLRFLTTGLCFSCRSQTSSLKNGLSCVPSMQFLAVSRWLRSSVLSTPQKPNPQGAFGICLITASLWHRMLRRLFPCLWDTLLIYQSCSVSSLF